MLELAAVAPNIVTRAVVEMPDTMGPREDQLSTLAILAFGLLLVAVAIRSAIKE